MEIKPAAYSVNLTNNGELEGLLLKNMKGLY